MRKSGSVGKPFFAQFDPGAVWLSDLRPAFADYYSGEIRVDGMEIEDAKWFDVKNLENLPRLPARISIARKLIDAAKGEMLAS
jgi:hypothetical protein